MSREPQNISEEELVARLREGDTKAVSQLYDMYNAALYGVVLQIVKVEETAEDVLQEAFVKIWNSFPSYDASKGRLFTWMINVCRNLAIDKIRSKQHRVSLKTREIPASPRADMGSDSFKPEHIGLREITEALNPDQKLIIDLMYFEGLTQSEIADEYQIPLGTVKTRARSAIKVLAKMFKGRG
ncbi:RNA polymerase sigma factor [Pontibacter akesuensis]|uniref:RNA polymerase sigma-70 factor, ECF subfamily n=1 Tax=Pontibacter akesuensis TaxID=388950 RepID=A0A1I7KGW6_9BACT|nr:sigma-70 family RNA polymerase sigma factor [Pontibacter akesuensis]GHA79146.1 DNA-directed RNA polymerase sigma-70 factor [Pontibacter akesuensis]SFU96669.1 RNA polymerase sigma-70 factor, ECF subfamily [Pontibacter akesuensis]